MADSGTPKEWPLEETEQLAEYEMFRVRRDRVRVPRTGEARDFHVVESPDGVTVIALTAGGEVVLVEQFREPLREVTLELPSGVVDEGEAPAAAGVRELREETGYGGGSIESLGTIVLNPSWQTTRVHVVLLGGVAPESEKDLDPGEDTRVRLIRAARLRELVATGEIRNATSLAALALGFWAGHSADRAASESPLDRIPGE